MRLLVLLLALLAALPALSAPVAQADPVAGAGFNSVKVRWTFGGVSGECWDDVAYATVHVNFKLLAAAQTTRDTFPDLGIPYDPMTLLPDSMCALLVTITPGAYTNACQILSGQGASPIVTTDPYFHYDNGYWRKTIGWGGWDYVDYTFQTDYRSWWSHLHGECRWGDAWGWWDVEPNAIFV